MKMKNKDKRRVRFIESKIREYHDKIQYFQYFNLVR